MIKDKYFRFLFTATIILLLALFASCNPYQKIATDVNRSDKNTTLLRQTCETAFPSIPPTFIKGETIIKTNTVKSTDTLTIIDTFNNIVTKYVTKTNTVTVERLRTDTVIITNKYEINRLNTVISEQVEQIIKNEIEIKNLKETNRKNKFAKFSGWSILILLLGIYGFIKLKFR